ncbi:MAG: GatB/YqeY domain-containing protein [Peptostreptococcaceae bacterium]|nr:GatB/YqeY domain-containing protein [Peptostreptococcaceae bacterium]
MALKEKLMEDLKIAMKEKNALRKSVVTLVRSAIKQIEVDQRVELADEEIIDIIAKQVKQRRDALEEFKKASREDLIDQTENEIEILKTYLPEQLTEEEIEVMVQQVIDEVDAKSMKDMGKVMGILSNKTKGIADGKVVSMMVKSKLS